MITSGSERVNKVHVECSLYYKIYQFVSFFSRQYKENKSFCEDLTEGKFSFPIIHGIRNDSRSTRIMSILCTPNFA